MKPSSLDKIRNFCIIAHIDHGKSTLADRLLELTKTISHRDFQDQVLDSMDIERERGITIKSQAITMGYDLEGESYRLNLVDTPGHVDFSYEVSRAISSCEGALLLIDASQGVEAQTFSNLFLAMEHNLEIIPVINKIDLPGADVERIKEQIEHDLGMDSEQVFPVSAKTGEGIDALLKGLVQKIPPKQESEALKALIFDSHYDPFRGVIVHVRVFDGKIEESSRIRFMSNQAAYKVEETGIFQLKLAPQRVLQAGEVGYIIAGIKSISDVQVGDTITGDLNPCDTPLEGFKEIKPVVFSSIYPIDVDQYSELAAAMEKLQLNDASLFYEKDSSVALGFGFRCGFLGLLHLEVIQERLEREFNLNVILTSPSVQYRVTMKGDDATIIDNPLQFPDPSQVEFVEEPYIRATIITPAEYLGNIMTHCTAKRGVQINMNYLDQKRVEIVYELPLSEILFDFYDKLKSVSRGYASFDYELIGYKEVDLVKLDILVNAEVVDALSLLVFKEHAYARGRVLCKKLKDEIPRQQFKIPIQAAIGNTIVARETISALRKDVTAKCYGGDISRKRKLLEKQREGKKRMKMVGSVELPQSAFLSTLKTGQEG